VLFFGIYSQNEKTSYFCKINNFIKRIMKKSSFVAILMLAFGMLFSSAVVADNQTSTTGENQVEKGLEGNSAQDVSGEWLPE
jgi:hypothetical protein